MISLLLAVVVQVFVRYAHAEHVPVVFSATWSNGGLLEVFSDDSYRISHGGQPWLQNSTTAIFLNGTWYSTTSPSSNSENGLTPQCNIEKDVDFRGNDLYYVDDAQGADVCCSYCAKEPQCAAWTWTGQTNTDTSNTPSITKENALPPWANRCYLKTSTAGFAHYPGHVSGVHPGRERRLVRVGAQPYSGNSTSLGAFRGWNISYMADRTSFVVSFIFYSDVELLVFSQWYGDGVHALNLTHAINSTFAPVNEFASSMQPSTLFPTFIPADGAAASSKTFGYLTWQGRFASALWGADIDLCSSLSHVGGAEGGPLVVFNSSESDRLAHSLVWSSFNNFKATILGYDYFDYG